MLMGRGMDRKPRDPMEGLYHVFFMTEATRVTPDRLEGGAISSPQPDCKCLCMQVSFKFNHHRRQQIPAGGDGERLPWTGAGEEGEPALTDDRLSCQESPYSQHRP